MRSLVNHTREKSHWIMASCMLLMGLLTSGCDGSIESKRAMPMDVLADGGITPGQLPGGDMDVMREDDGTIITPPDASPDMSTPPSLPTDGGLKRLTDEQFTHALFDVSTTLSPELATRDQYRVDVFGSLIDADGKRYRGDRFLGRGLYAAHQTSQSLAQRLDGLAPYDAYVRMAIYTAGMMVRDGSSTLYKVFLDEDRDEEQSRAFVAQWLSEQGHHFFRRPLEPQEIVYYRDVVMRYPMTPEHVRELLAALLLAPDFLYAIEVGEEEIVDVETGRVALTPHELASRMAMFLWQGPPDEALFAAARDGSLREEQVMRAQVTRMLQDERADRFLLRLGLEWLGIEPRENELDFNAVNASEQIKNEYEGIVTRRVKELDKEEREAARRLANDPNDDNPYGYNTDVYYKGILGTLEPFIMQDLVDFLRHVIVTQKGSIRDIFLSNAMTARHPYIASLYGISEAWDGTGAPPTHDQARGGLLGRIAFLATPSPRTRPVIRGLRIRKHVLCTEIPEPENADFVFTVPSNPPFSTRAMVEFSTERPEVGACIACHQAMNGLGFSFSRYNIYGREREREVYYFDGTEYGRLDETLRAQIQDRENQQKQDFEQASGRNFDEVDQDNDRYYISGMPHTLEVDITRQATPQIDLGDSATTVNSPLELAQLLANREDVSQCLAEHLVHIGLDGAIVTQADRAAFEQAIAGESIEDALMTLIASESFQSKTYGRQLVPSSPPE